MKWFFEILASINKALLPSFYKRDLQKLKTWEKAIVGYRLWVVKKILP